MIVFSLLPIGLAQAVASVDVGLWYARSAEFLQQPFIIGLRWAHMLGHVVFLVGVGAFVWFLIGLARRTDPVATGAGASSEPERTSVTPELTAAE